MRDGSGYLQRLIFWQGNLLLMYAGTIRTVDLFAGIGGIRLGFEGVAKNRMNTVFVNDSNPKCAETYRENFSDGPDMKIAPLESILVKKIPDFDLLLGGFPCQAFSIAGRRKGFDDTRGTLFFQVAKVLKEKRPRAFLLENVQHLKNHDHGKTFEKIEEVLTKRLGYDIHYTILNSKDFGVPQNRPRIYIVGFRNKTKFSFPGKARTRKFIGDVLEHDVSEEYYISQKYYEGMERHKNRHAAKGNGFGYVVLDRDEVANTLVLGGMGRERNLIQDKVKKPYSAGKDKLKYKNKRGLRKLTVRECARVQGFPDSFVFPVSKTEAYRQIANSVSVPVIKAVARRMLRHL